MTTKIEITHEGLGGPYIIKLNDTEIYDVEDYSLWHKDGTHRLTITLLADNFHLKRLDDQPKPDILKRFGSFVKRHTQ